MGRRGRKRKYGARYPGGQRKRRPEEEKIEERVRLARNMPHRRAARSNDRISELAESPLGRLRLNDTISEAHYQAGSRYAVIIGEYRAILLGPKMMAGGGRGLECAQLCAAAHELLDARQRVEVREGLARACTCLDRRNRYDDAYEAVLGGPYAGPDHAAARAVAEVVGRGEELGAERLVHLVRGLERLARHFGLTERRAS